MSHPKLPQTYTNSEFGGETQRRRCLRYELDIDLHVYYSKVGSGNAIEWGGAVALSAWVTKTYLKEKKCDIYRTVDIEKKCPYKCETRQGHYFNGTKCGKPVSDKGGLGEFMAHSTCAPDGKCNKNMLFVPKAQEKCLGVKHIDCNKTWITCDEETELDDYFGIGSTGKGSRSISLGYYDDWNGLDNLGDNPGPSNNEAKARIAYSVLKTIRDIEKTPKKYCALCEYVCCLMKGMLPGGGGPSCSHEDEFGGGPQMENTMKWRCSHKWASFLMDPDCEDEVPPILDNTAGDIPCQGCCKELF